MAHINYLGLRVSTSASSLLSVSGSGCGHYAKCETAKNIALNGWRNEHAKSWVLVFHEMEKWDSMKWRNGEMVTDAPRLTATAVAMDSRRRLLKRSLEWHMPTSKILQAMIRKL